MRTIYKSIAGKNKIIELYDEQLNRLNVSYKDVYIKTSFGTTHNIETGSLEKELLLVFRGGNAITYNLLTCDFLLQNSK